MMTKSALHLAKCWQAFIRISSRNLTSAIKPTLTMYTKEDCSLCDDAKEILIPYLKRVHFEEVNILEPGNEDYLHKYRFDIPVFHLNGNYLMKHRVDKDSLETALSGLNKSQP